MAEYDLNIFYKKGTELTHNDYISSNIQGEIDPADNRMFAFIAWEGCEIFLLQLEKIIRPQDINKTNLLVGFAVYDKIIYYTYKVYVPKSLRNTIINACHSLFPFTHLGQKKTIRKINQTFSWPNLGDNVKGYINACLIS